MPRIHAILGCTLLCACSTYGQVPGDGIPDVYYNFTAADTLVDTTFGQITLPGGVITIDTDGTEMVAFSFSGPNVFPLQGGSGCELCDGMNLPGTDAVGDVSTWATSYSGQVSEWLRTNPLTGPGFRGVIGIGFVDGNDVQQPWPDDIPSMLDFPAHGQGIANVGAGAEFPKLLGPPGAPNSFNFQWSGGYTNITFVPEPSALGLVTIACLLMLGVRKRG